MSNLEICKVVLTGNFDLFKEYAEAHLELLTKPDESGRSCLHWAAYIGHVDMIKFILNYECDIDKSDELGWTALIIAVSAGRNDAVMCLIEKGANVNHVNNTGQCCLHYAASKNRLELAAYLLANNATIDVQDNTSQTTPLHRAVSKNQLQMSKLLMDNKAQINIPDIEGNTVLHYACEDGEVEMVAELLKRNADKTRRNKEGLLPIDLAKGGAKTEIKSLFA